MVKTYDLTIEETVTKTIAVVSRDDYEALEKRLAETKRELEMWMSYAEGHGNCTGVCAGGFPQQNGLICQACGRDRSEPGVCGIQNTAFAKP
jgi:hypothetical protein